MHSTLAAGAAFILAVSSPSMLADSTAMADWTSVDGSRPLQLLFQVDFENGLEARDATGAVMPAAVTREGRLPALVEGITGSAAQFGQGQVLRYSADGHLNKDRGAISMWVRPAVDGVGAPGERYQLFSGEGRGSRANLTDLGVIGDSELRFRQGAGSDSLHLPQAREWRRGEWHHLILNWDATRGDVFAYLDGRPAGWAGGSLLRGYSYDHSPWETRDHDAFLLGARNASGADAWLGAIDEFRIFDRALTPDEARVEYLRFGHLGVEVEVLDRYLFAGRAASCRLIFENRAAVDTTVNPRYEILDESGARVGEGVLPAVRIRAGQSQRVVVSPTLPAVGPYVLTISFGNEGRTVSRSIDLLGLAEKESGQSGPGQLPEVATVDAINPPAIAESAPSTIIRSQLGDYREAGPNQHDRFALSFEVEDLGQPHLAVITYPDDKPRTMEVILQNLDGVEDRQCQIGFSTGKEYPLSGRMITQSLLFWPKSPRYALIFMTGVAGQPAALQGITIQRAENGLSPSRVTSFRGSVPARRIGVYFEDPVIPKNYGDAAHFPGFAGTVDRLLDYMAWFGQDVLTYPVVWYRGPIYKSAVEPFSPVAGTRPHVQDFPSYLMRRLAARDMAFLPVFAQHEIPSLAPLAITDMRRVAAGEETVINVRSDDTLSLHGSHGRDSDFNPLDPRVQDEVKALLAEFLDLYGDEPAMAGVMFLPARHKLYQFGSSDSGYNDINLRRFQEETGMRIPVEPGDPKRFSKSHAWLKANAWESWIAWRCRKIHRYYQEIAGMLTARRPDLKLVLGLLPRLDDDKAVAQYLPQPAFLKQLARAAGVDVDLFAGDGNIEFEFLARVGTKRWMEARGRFQLAADSRTLEHAPEIVAPLAANQASSYVLYDRYWENAVGRNAPMDLAPLAGRPVQEMPWRVSAFNPNGVHCLENYVAALNNLDAERITRGGFVVGSLGTEPYVARFAQAYRALPAIRFDDVQGLADPVRVRQRVVDGDNYFYVLNRLPVAVDVELSISDTGPVIDLIMGKEVGAGRSLKLSLEPYDLRVFRADPVRGVVSGGQAVTPNAFVSDLERQLDVVGQRLAVRRARDGDMAVEMAHLQCARQWRERREFARLYRGLQEGWATDEAENLGSGSKAHQERAKSKAKN